MTERCCFDRILPKDLRRPLQLMDVGGRTRAITPLRKLWINGSTLRVRFLSGSTSQRDLVKRHAPTWCQHANLRFSFTDDPAAEIRVTFDPNDGAWSYIGTDARSIPVYAPTLNLGWLEQDVILHEFGHAIGLAHEHQNPQGGIQWNEPAVIASLSGPPNYWDEATIRYNVLERYRFDQVNGTAFDPKSVMLYGFPASWTLNGVGTSSNSTLSDLDKAFVASAQMYPGTVEPEITDLVVVEPKPFAAEISTFGEEDRYRFKVSSPGTYVVETTGTTDVVMKLFGPNSMTALIAEDDDSGAGTNSRIAASLPVGDYYVQIRHYNRTSGRGRYSISVLKT